MLVGFAAALGSAIAWAVAVTLMASQTARLDALSLSLIRALWAAGFFVAALFVLGDQGEFSRMTVNEMAQMGSAGFLAAGLGEALYAVAIAHAGMTVSFTIIIGLYNLFAYLFSAIFLGQAIDWLVGLGSLLAIAGVYVVTLYGRARPRPPLARSRSDSRPLAGGSDAPALVRLPLDVPLPLVGRTVPRFGFGVTIAILTAIIWATSIVWLNRSTQGFAASAAVLTRMPLILLFTITGAALWPRSNLRRRDFPIRSQGALAVSGVLGTGLGSLLVIVALQEIGSGKTVVLFTTAPLWGLPMAVLFLGERVTRWAPVGAVLAVMGIALIFL